MRREVVNAIRFGLEELIPPIIRDSNLMRALFRLVWGRLIDDLEKFRSQIVFIGASEYSEIYSRLPRVQSDTDNSQKCIELIIQNIEGKKVLDVGCGTGFLLQKIIEKKSGLELTGVDFQIDPVTERKNSDINFKEAEIEQLPFQDDSFDTVICTHVLEHILDINIAIKELRRVCNRKLIIVVPVEREYKFTFNPHVHFFPYVHSFLRYIKPIPSSYSVQKVGRDIFYTESK